MLPSLPRVLSAIVVGLALALLLPKASALAVSDEAPVSDESVTENSKTQEKPAVSLKKLQDERVQVMEELVALEEGYSKIGEERKTDSSEVQEAQLQARLTQLQSRLDKLDAQIAARKKKEHP